MCTVESPFYPLYAFSFDSYLPRRATMFIIHSIAFFPFESYTFPLYFRIRANAFLCLCISSLAYTFALDPQMNFLFLSSMLIVVRVVRARSWNPVVCACIVYPIFFASFRSSFSVMLSWGMHVFPIFFFSSGASVFFSHAFPRLSLDMSLVTSL